MKVVRELMLRVNQTKKQEQARVSSRYGWGAENWAS